MEFRNEVIENYHVRNFVLVQCNKLNVVKFNTVSHLRNQISNNFSPGDFLAVNVRNKVSLHAGILRTALVLSLSESTNP